MERLQTSSFSLELAHPVVCIVGPTASGKTAVSQLVAKRLNAEIVSADSMQIYQGMDIGTGKIPIEERIVPHYGLDLITPGEPYSAALFQQYARECFKDIDSRGKRSILCGGTGFYVRAALDDYEFPEGGQRENAVRDHYLAYAAEYGNQAVWSVLNECDPRSAACVHPHNVKRVIRALELHAVGESYADQVENLAHIKQYTPAVLFGLRVDPDELRTRIDRRIEDMVDNGLVDEVEYLLSQGFEKGITAPQAIGYKEIVWALRGEISLSEAIDKIKIATHRYAKRQRSWFKKDHRIIWIESTDKGSFDVASVILEALE